MKFSTFGKMILILHGLIILPWYAEALAEHSSNDKLENLALNRRTWQEFPWQNTNMDVGSQNAVDGLYYDRGTGGQCAISDDYKLTATWYVDLGNVLSISHVDIYYRTDNEPSPTKYTSQMAGFYLYISNTTSKEDGYLCFHEIQNKTNTPLEDQRINCPVHGRYVIYYNERRPGVVYPSFYSQFAYIGLCEVEVYGCRESGYFGNECSLVCPKNCQESRCHIQTGYCLGCIPGYEGVGCNKVCSNNTYGLECAVSCGNCNDGKPCNNINGTCHTGCNEGVEGNMCQDKCKPGFYGKNCVKECSENCNVPKRCDMVTGQCDEGCKPGWNPTTCDQKCENGTFGENCHSKCGHCLEVSHCHFINGSCLKGCSHGYKGDQCNDPCSIGEFGINCSHVCSAFCKGNSSCNAMTGICNEGCKEGWNSPFCGSAGGEGTSGGINQFGSFILQVLQIVIFASVIFVY